MAGTVRVSSSELEAVAAGGKVAQAKIVASTEAVEQAGAPVATILSRDPVLNKMAGTFRSALSQTTEAGNKSSANTGTLTDDANRINENFRNVESGSAADITSLTDG